VLPLLAHRHQTVVAQDLEVLGHRRLADAQLGHQLGHAHLAATPQAGEQFAAGSVGEHVEDIGHTPG